MGKQTDTLSPDHRAFIARQRMFFVATSASGARINLSPKGLETLRILDDSRIAYLDLTGSGNETAAHLLADGRITLMLCAFEGPPKILRVYGRGIIEARSTPGYDTILRDQFGGLELPGARQIVVIHIELVQTSCGFGVPLYEFRAERPQLVRWAEEKGDQGLTDYRHKKNRLSLDGLPTGLPRA